MGHDDHEHDHAHPHSHEHHGHEHHGEHRHDSPTSREHRAQAPAQVAAFVITCSDSRGEREDETGAELRRLLEGAGHSLAGSRVVKDEAAQIREAVEAAIAAGARAVIVNGGTGIGRRDVTIETVRALFEKELPGFGELFRALSFREIGTAAMLSRATAGTFRGAIVFALPGSPAAATLAMEQLILPELGHLVRELTR